MATAETGRRAYRPRDAADVAELLASCDAALEPVGLGSKRALGSPVRADLLDLSALTGIVDYEPAELVLTARAATPLSVIRAELARHGQRLAFEPPDFGPLLGAGSSAAGQTLGGVLAANLSGSRRIAAGAARDHFLGFRAVTGDGTPFKAGGRVVKNVTGYDLPKLLAGSWGTLAVLTEVTVRVAPLPETEVTAIVPAADAGAAVATLTAALSSPNDVSAAAFVPGLGCALRVEGFEASVAARVRSLLAALDAPDAETLPADGSRELWSRVGAAADLGAAPFVVRAAVPPAEAARAVAALAPERYLLDWGGGLIWAAYGDVDVGKLRRAARFARVTLWKAPREARAASEVFPPDAAPVAGIAARLKAALDPGGRLNPGRMGTLGSRAGNR